MQARHQHFGLTLMVNHACNLRCTYCYTGAKFSSPMTWEIGVAAIQRGFRSVTPGGRLDLSFFGGEPLLEAERIQSWIGFARRLAADSGQKVRFNLTTNGTITHPEAWSILMLEDVEVALSFDGTPALHDRHRYDAQGRGTSEIVARTLDRLERSQKEFAVIVVVRPDGVAEIPAALHHLHSCGVRQVHLSLDLWTRWNAADAIRLKESIDCAAELWRQWLPEFSLNWFDAKAAELACLPAVEQGTRCGFGNGEIAVAPSGRLYPCERLIGEDRPNQPLRLPGHALEGEDFLGYSTARFERASACSGCALVGACDTTCRCSNFIRTGQANQPDGLLCLVNKATARATARVLARGEGPRVENYGLKKEKSYA